MSQREQRMLRSLALKLEAGYVPPDEAFPQKLIAVLAEELDDLESRVLGIRFRPNKIPGIRTAGKDRDAAPETPNLDLALYIGRAIYDEAREELRIEPGPKASWSIDHVLKFTSLVGGVHNEIGHELARRINEAHADGAVTTAAVVISRSDLRRVWEFARENPRYIAPQPKDGESWEDYCGRREDEEKFLARIGALSVETIVCTECGAQFGPGENCTEEAIAHAKEHTREETAAQPLPSTEWCVAGLAHGTEVVSGPTLRIETTEGGERITLDINILNGALQNEQQLARWLARSLKRYREGNAASPFYSSVKIGPPDEDIFGRKIAWPPEGGEGKEGSA